MRPQLDVGGEVWRVPVVLTYAVVGPVGEVGEVLVSAAGEEVGSHTPVEEMKERARSTLYEQRREQIEAPFPKQETTYSCVPACLRMVLSGLGPPTCQRKAYEC